LRILITGGAGYVGCRLVAALLVDGHDVVVYDTFWFGDHLPQTNETTPYLVKVQADIRDIGKFRQEANGCGVVIHLACLSNDPSSEIDADLTRSINLDAFEPLVVAAKEAGVRRFIYCSSSSVYGISDAPDVREDHPLVPLTLYNRYKAECEPLLMRHRAPGFECVVLRPSTVCGYSPRQRLDLAVNILTNLAYSTGKIIVRGGGQQMRPNLHIADMVDCYRALLAAPADKVDGETFNVGAGNISIADLALIVKREVGRLTGRSIRVETVADEFDPRSYQVNSDKIRDVLGFVPQRTVEDAVAELVDALADGRLPDPMDCDEYYNVRTMKRVFADLYKDAPPSMFRPEDGVLSEIDMRRGAGK
jgi:nucleoside-diphosphate-sugar epimerase